MLLPQRSPSYSIRRLARVLMQPVVGFGLIIIALVWAGTWHLANSERDQRRHELAAEAANLTLVFEQNVIRTARELDRVLKFIRRSYERSNFSASWQGLVRDDYTVNDESVQIAIMDARGMMITSTAMLYPIEPVDLSDREHFRVHAVHADDREKRDQLFISAPVLGRASGKWSVQFTRPYWDGNGRFAGVVVVSLDPAHLTRAYNELKLGSDHGLALIGSDNIVRSGAGIFAALLGKASPIDLQAGLKFGGTTVQQIDDASGHSVAASRPVAGYPLQVLVEANDPSGAAMRGASAYYLAGAGALSIFVFVAMLASALNRLRYEARILKHARVDTLTGLPNRLALNEQLGGPAGAGQALILVDLDGFKDVNDTHGHPIGDRLLTDVAARLRRLTRGQDFLARLGGDEFAVVLETSDGETAQILADRIVVGMAEPFAIADLHVTIGASLGISACARGNDPADLMQQADLALYSAKAEGRGTFRFYREALDLAVRERNALFEGLRTALRDQAFELHYQPIVDARSRRTTCFEGLLRWRQADGSYLPPVKFIPVAEETGLIGPIGAWAIEQACHDAALLPKGVSIAVNCSAVQFKDGRLAATVREALTRTGARADQLKIEITESILLDHSGGTLKQLHELAALGIELAIDDFGTGYSSLGYLEAYPVTCLKIDQSFIAAMTLKESTLAIVRMIISLARCLNMKTIAEGVETEDQFALLRALGCDEVQGYIISPALPRDQAFALSAGRESAPLSA